MEKRKLKNILVTGGAGFIGCNFIRFLFEQKDFDGIVVNVDKLTYAGNPGSLSDIGERYGSSPDQRYFFEKVDICDKEGIDRIFLDYNIDTVVNFAAESHVDRSIYGPDEFIKTNITGTFVLLEAARKHWQNKNDVLFHHISTDEVYGSLGETGQFHESTKYDPHSPYSASKASSDHLCSAYFYTYGLPVTISNCSNNYGPYQFPEKLIPVIILNILGKKQLPIYGDGKNIRDWLFVEDHCSGIWKILRQGRVSETYNIGGDNEWTNLELVEKICLLMDDVKPSEIRYNSLITFIKDRPGHDQRYAINCEKIKNELGWKAERDFESGLKITINWYLENQKWINNIRTGEYLKWIDKNYGNR